MPAGRRHLVIWLSYVVVKDERKKKKEKRKERERETEGQTLTNGLTKRLSGRTDVHTYHMGTRQTVSSQIDQS